MFGNKRKQGPGLKIPDRFEASEVKWSLTGEWLDVALSRFERHYKELHIHSGGWNFMDEDKLAPAVSHAGWNERFEPAFSSDVPILRIK